MHRTVRYDMSKSKGVLDHDGFAILAFSIRSTDGTDEAHCAKTSEARGTSLTEELIRFSLVSYETEEGLKLVNKGATPFVEFDKWSSKARNFVIMAWKQLSVPDDQEMADFLASASDV